jgi:hypothetical protein
LAKCVVSRAFTLPREFPFKGLHDRPFASGDKGLLKALLQGATGFAALPAME